MKYCGFIRAIALLILGLILAAAGFGCASKPLKLPAVDAGLAETVVVTRNGWDRDILPSSSAEVKEYIGKELASCEPVKAYKSWDEIFPDGNVYGSPNTVTLIFPNDGEIAIQCFLIGGYVNFMDAGEDHLYLVDDAWLTNFIETVTAMVENAPDERYIEKTESAAEYEFHVMTDDNAPIGCEAGINKEGRLDALEMLAELENLKGFVFPADSGIMLRFFFSQEPEDVYVRFISEDHWQEEYPYGDSRMKVPDEPGIYNVFVDIGWESNYFETAFFSVTVLDREFSQAPDYSSISVGVFYDDAANVQMLYNTNQRIGTEEELENVMSFLTALKVEDVTLLAAASMPSDTHNEYRLSSDELAQFIVLINALKPTLLPEEEFGNPYTGGAWFVRIETESQELYISDNGWFCVVYPENKETLIFEAESNKDTFNAIDSFIWNKTKN